MSEYQYYEFTAVDRPLTTREQSELRSLSTRADITATSFVNTYEWGNFKGDPRKLMERYFDAHLYLANWGTRELMLRLPTRVLDPAVVTDYCVGDSAAAWTSGKHVVIHLNREDENGTDEWDIDGEGLLASIIPARAGLTAGDLRLLYLGWLRCAQSLEVSNDEPEPPVPAGLATLDAPLTAVAEFLCIDRDLIAAAAAGSAPATAAQPTATQLRTWVTRLPTREKDTILSDLITGDDTHLRAQLLRRYRDAVLPKHPPRPPHAPPVNCSPPPANCGLYGKVATSGNVNETGSAGSAPRPPPGNDTWTPSRSISPPHGSGSTNSSPRRSRTNTTQLSNYSSTCATSPNATATPPRSSIV